MDISSFNKTLSWLDEVVVKNFNDDEYDLVVAIDAEGGGPGENVTAFIAFRSVCYLSIPMVMEFSDFPQIRMCSFDQAVALLPIQDLSSGYDSEIEDGCMKVIQFLDGDKGLCHFVACYGVDLWQDPKDWSYGSE